MEFEKLQAIRVGIKNNQIDERKTEMRWRIQEKVVRRALGRPMPQIIIRLIKAFTYGSPLVFLKPVWSLAVGSINYGIMTQQQYDKMNNLSYQESRDYLAALKNQVHQRREFRRTYSVARNRSFYVGNRHCVQLCKIGQIWTRIKRPRLDRIVEYNQLLVDFLRKDKYSLICDDSAERLLNFHINNVVEGQRNFNLDWSISSIVQLIQEDMLWLSLDGYNYLCFPSQKLINGLFGLKFDGRTWQFTGYDLILWSQGFRSPTQSFVRFDARQFFITQDNMMMLCYSRDQKG